MSETVKITVVTENDKLHTSNQNQTAEPLVLTHDISMTLMSTLLRNDLLDGSLCGGRGDCGRCAVRFLEGAPIPTPLERSVLAPEELREGYRLSCFARPKDDCVICIPPQTDKKIEIISEMIDVTANIDRHSQQKNETKYRKTPDMIVAVDLGTTTIAMQLVELSTGQIADTYCEVNPQRRYGADVLSRMQASVDGCGEELQRLAAEVLARGLRQFTAYAESRAGHLLGMCIAGNTTMEHLLLGYDVSGLGRSPFTPVNISLQKVSAMDIGLQKAATGEIGLPEGGTAAGGVRDACGVAADFPVWIAPGISVFVGGDIVAGLYACGLLPDQAAARQTECGLLPDQAAGQPECSILIDLGTNGEMAVTDGRRLIVTATAAGPAFEGGAGAVRTGSDMVAALAALLREGAMDRTGLLSEAYSSENAPRPTRQDISSESAPRPTRQGTSLGTNPPRLTQQDVRALQMAKAAVRAGIEILWEKIGRLPVKQVFLAGGFGYYLDVEAAFAIGLLPEDLRGRVRAAGNTSLRGAYLIGRDLWRCGSAAADALAELPARAEAVNLAEEPAFERLYLEHLSF